MDESLLSSGDLITNEGGILLQSDIFSGNQNQYVDTVYHASTAVVPTNLIQANPDAITLAHATTGIVSIFDNDTLSGTMSVNMSNVMMIMTG